MAYRSQEKAVAPSLSYIIVSTSQHEFQLQTLNQLEGLVRISTKEDALRFVRLRTSVTTSEIWPIEEFEVMTFTEARQQYLYDLTVQPSYSSLASGWEGIVTSSDFISGRFQPPVIQAVPLGFQITRWLFQPSQSSQIAQVFKVRELVDSDGTYSRTILTSRVPPALPGTVWTANQPWCCMRLNDPLFELGVSANCIQMSHYG